MNKATKKKHLVKQEEDKPVRVSIRSKLLGAFGVLIIFSLTFAGVWNYSNSVNILGTNISNMGVQHVIEIARNIDEMPSPQAHMAEIDAMLRELKLGISATAFVINRDGRTIAGQAQGQITGDSLKAILNDTKGAYIDKKSNDVITFARLKEGGLFLVEYYPWKDYAGSVSRVKTVTLALAIVTLLFSAIVAFFISGDISRPIGSMVNVMRGVGKGDLSGEIKVVTDDEVGMLVRNLNTMVKELRDKVGLEVTLHKLQELDEIKTRFFANVSHEFRTPLTMIMAPLELMLAGELGKFDESQTEHIDAMYRNSLRLYRLINDLLDFSKIEAGKMTMVFEPTDIIWFVKYIVSSVSSMADRMKIQLSFEAKASVPRIYIDREKIERVILNLLSNAFKFTREGGKVKVKIEEAPGAVQLIVSDTGIGIPESHLKKIFDRFVQVDGSASREHEGTGIGLALAKELVDLHKGNISVQSELGMGSTFTVELKKGTAHIEDKKAIREAADESDYRIKDRTILAMSDIETKKEREEKKEIVKEHTILIVEDNPDVIKFISFLLKDSYSVLTACDGVEGIEKVKQASPDLVISDVMMPRKDGYQLCREIKMNPETRHTPVILLTAKAELAMKIEGLEFGADDYIVKPFNSKELLARIRTLLRQKGMEKEIQQKNVELESYSKILEDKVKEQIEKIEGMKRLERYLSPKVAQAVMDGGKGVELKTSRKKLTVVFSDIRGFTSLSDELEPEEVVETLNDYFSEMLPIIHKYDGTLDKFIGDGIMIFFGNPVYFENHAERAVRMAIDMQKRVEELHSLWSQKGRKPIAIGIGINTGYVTVGSIGPSEHMDYTVIGTQVNLSARLQEFAKPGEIIISNSTYGEIRDIVEVDPRGDVTVKGLKNPVTIYSVKRLI